MSPTKNPNKTPCKTNQLMLYI